MMEGWNNVNKLKPNIPIFLYSNLKKGGENDRIRRK